MSQRAAGYEHLPQNGPYRPDRTRAEGKQRLASGPTVVSTLPLLIAKSQRQGSMHTHTHTRARKHTHFNACIHQTVSAVVKTNTILYAMKRRPVQNS